MPSGKTHDAITFILAVPAAAVVWWVTQNFAAAATVAAAFLFGGLMFGPDLDTVSRQYSRWAVFRFLWYPYRSFFKHRSRFSHGLIFGALIRVLYFMGVTTLIAYIAVFIWMKVTEAEPPNIADFAQAWRHIGTFLRNSFGEDFLHLTFLGLWQGAASHTFTDMAGSFVKTGRVSKFL